MLMVILFISRNSIDRCRGSDQSFWIFGVGNVSGLSVGQQISAQIIKNFPDSFSSCCFKSESVVRGNRFKLAAKLVYHYYIPKMPDIEHDSGRNRNLLVIKFMEMVSAWLLLMCSA